MDPTQSLSGAFASFGQSKDPQIARTILQQLGGSRRLSAMTGAHNFIDHGAGVSFRVKGTRSPRPNYVKILLDARTGTYTVSFGRIHGLRFKELGTTPGIFVGGLRGLVEDKTGLRLHL